MLTCSINGSLVNTLDYNDSDIRAWSNKKILRCEVCGSEMVYKNGKIKIPHFAHKSKCDILYSETESYEHMTGKLELYNWLKSQNVVNLKLEYWMEETKQRPDIYFELNGNKYVIEYQCSPISSEFIERHSLYSLAGIHDIWILGTEKYNINTDVEIDIENYRNRLRMKFIESELITNDGRILYLKNKKLIKVNKIKYSDAITIVDAKTTYFQDFTLLKIDDLLYNTLKLDEFFNIDMVNIKLNALCKLLKKKNIWCTTYKYNIDIINFKVVIRKDNLSTPIFECLICELNEIKFQKFLESELKIIKFENKERRLIDKIYNSDYFKILSDSAYILNDIQNKSLCINYESKYLIDDFYITSLQLHRNNEIIFSSVLNKFDVNKLKTVFICEKTEINRLNELKKIENRLKIGGINGE